MRQAIAALGLTAALAACTVSSRTGYFGDDLAGANVERTIDTEIAPALAVTPGLTVGHAACPDHLNVSLGKTGYCSLPVGDATLRVAVTAGNQYGAFVVKPADQILDMRELERRENAMLLDGYDLVANVRCGAPRIRVAVAGTRFRCALLVRNGPAAHIDVRIVDSAGHVVTSRPPGLRPSIPSLVPYLYAHHAGRRTVIPGRLLERSINKLMRGPSFSTNRIVIGATTCPAEVDLSGRRHGLCRQRVVDGTLRVAVSIDEPGGFHVQTLDYALSTKRVLAVATELYRKRVEAYGYAGTVAVDCGPERIVITTPERGIPCTLSYGGATKHMIARPEPDGRIRIDVP